MIAIAILSLIITGLLAAGSYISAALLGIEHWQAAVSGLLCMAFVFGGVFLIGCPRRCSGRK